MNQQLDLFTIKARNTDPETSHRAAAKVLTMRAGSQRWKLLRIFVLYYPTDFTDEEAAGIAGVSLTSEYATRCSELRNHGLIEPTGYERNGAAGLSRIVSIATEKGTQVFNDTLPK